MKIFHTLVLLFVLSCSMGCATPSKYEWGNYNNDLYKYYDRSINQEELITNLQLVIQKGEVQGNVVPPGMYAEYAYLLYETGHFNEAVGFFQKEYDRWPESRVLMVKMIRNCKTKMNPLPAGESKDRESPENEKTN
jgi:hypothetical protein